MRSRHPFDAEKAQMILAYIRQGGFPNVAAEAARVPRRIFRSWIRRGKSPRGRDPFRGFARDVMQAAAQARLLREVSMAEDEAKFWLSHGPGKETPGNPGWTGEVRPAAPARRPAVADSWQKVCADLVRVLAPYPEARQAAARALSAIESAGKNLTPAAVGVIEAHSEDLDESVRHSA